MNVNVYFKNFAKGRKFFVIAIIVMENWSVSNLNSNKNELSEDKALLIIQETRSDFGRYTKSQRLQIPRNIDGNCSFLPQRRVRYTSHPMPQSASLNIESDVYNTSEQNTEMSLSSESNNESYNKIFEDYLPPPY
ncbi:hypothetical protein C1646_766667 [Rhizophagus diaphanus]|nr:hypothetical protein C1646_766667 [Rhizophagus diaphanus] [Rhizophagus sp. MUCL 43196]